MNAWATGAQILRGDGWPLVEASPDAILVVDTGGSIRYANARAEALFGYTRAALETMAIDALVPERLRKRHRADRTRFAAEPRSREMGAGLELFAVAADGREFRVEISLSPLFAESEGLVMAAVRDITERVDAVAAARQVREVLDATRDAMTILDAVTLRFTYVNNGAVQQVGYAREELLDMTMLHITPEFDAATLRKLLAPLASGERSSALINTVHRRRDGEDIAVEILFQAVPGEDGVPRSYVKIARDITERQEAEANLRRAEQELRLLEDRERIARDLHDVVIQRLFASGLTLEAALSQITDPAVVNRLSPIVDELDDAIKDLRSTIFRLRARPRVYTPRADLLRIIEEQQAALGFEPQVHLDGPIDGIPENVLRELLPTLREALANVARHANATRVSVSVSAGTRLDLRVEDDGRGIAPDHRHGDGIRNAASRADALGGTFDVQPRTEGGTVLTWCVPLAP